MIIHDEKPRMQWRMVVVEGQIKEGFVLPTSELAVIKQPASDLWRSQIKSQTTFDNANKSTQDSQ